MLIFLLVLEKRRLLNEVRQGALEGISGWEGEHPYVLRMELAFFQEISCNRERAT